MAENTRICALCCSTPQVALNPYQLAQRNAAQTEYFYVSTVQAATPGYVYQYKSQSERIQALIGRLSLNQCS